MKCNREKIWISLSDLFLDTDVSLFYERIISDIRESGFSDLEVEEILFDEVAPALAFNLHNIAGEWAGFDEEWLIDRIKIAKSKKIRAWINRVSIRSYTRMHWKSIMKLKQHQVAAGDGR